MRNPCRAGSSHPTRFRFATVPGLLQVLLVFLLFLPSALPAQLAFFDIASGGAGMGIASDGSNYLVGIENHLTSPTSIGAQMLTSSGAKSGLLLPTGRTGIATAVAFDGTNYLLIWEDDGLGTLNANTGWQIYGQFISRSGSFVGTPFSISTAGVWFDGIKVMAFGAGKYLVTYTRLIIPANGSDSENRYIAGRIVDPNGTLGGEFRISTGFGKASDVAFDGSNFFVIWCDDFNDSEIRGRFVSPSGVPGLEISVNASVAPSDNPNAVVYGNGNYFVLWNDETGGFESGEWNAFAQRVGTNGTLVGDVIPVATNAGPQIGCSAAFDGINFFAAWIDMQNPVDWNAHGRFVARNGACLGDVVTLSDAPENQLAYVSFANGRYLVGVAGGVIMGEGGLEQVGSTVGAFMDPLPEPRVVLDDGSFGIRTNRFGFSIAGVAGQTSVVETCTNLSGGAWSPVQTNVLGATNLSFSDPAWTNAARRFYRVRSL